MVKKYSVLICMIAFVVFMLIAASLYPGGSLLNKNAIGFDWGKNYFSNLFARNAINGSDNPGRIWAILSMVFLSVGFGVFFINSSRKIPSKGSAIILRYIGIANLLFILMIATPYHDLGVISIVLTLIGLFIITVFVLKSKLHVLKIGCIVCLLTYYVFFFFYGFGYLEWSAITQKIYAVSSILLAIGIEYFTQPDDFG